VEDGRVSKCCAVSHDENETKKLNPKHLANPHVRCLELTGIARAPDGARFHPFTYLRVEKSQSITAAAEYLLLYRYTFDT
jgi:hypothetical protein